MDLAPSVDVQRGMGERTYKNRKNKYDDSEDVEDAKQVPA
jgi:hypothetical protein